MAALRNMNTYDGVRNMWRAGIGLIKFLISSVLIIGVLAAAALAITIWVQLQEVPDLSYLANYDATHPIKIFDRYDNEICSIKTDQNRRNVSLNEISAPAGMAILAAEDHKFYEHHGVDLPSIIRASLTNLRAGHVVEGGSTITQQLVKNLFFEESGRTLQRKAAEAFVAWQLEQNYSKEQILEMYLNEAYFGNGAYGIEQAARYYFDKPASELTIPEAAFLAGLVRAPSMLGTRANRDKAMDNQQRIIDQMVAYGFISGQDGDIAKRQWLNFWEQAPPAERPKLDRYPYFVSYVLDLLQQRYSPSKIRRLGPHIYTTLDPVAQQLGEQMLKQGISKAPSGINQGALATVAVVDGSILALVGGVGSYWEHQYNCATHPHTAGSAFKPFVYLAAFERKELSPDSNIEDSPLVAQERDKRDYKPKNYDGKYMGLITVRDALVYSRNVPAVRIAQSVGVDNVVDTARRAGITSKLDANLSLALGSSAVTPVEMAGAYATFARGGYETEPWVIRRIENDRGRVIKVFDHTPKRTLQPQAVGELVSVLQEVVARGTGKRAALGTRIVGGKTGTSDQSRDLWFVGFTPEISTAVWGGNEDNKPVPGAHVTGGTIMAGIWHDYYKALYDRLAGKPGTILSRAMPDRMLPREEKAVESRKPEPLARTGGERPSQQRSQAPARRTSGIQLKPLTGRLDTSQPDD